MSVHVFEPVVQVLRGSTFEPGELASEAAKIDDQLFTAADIAVIQQADEEYYRGGTRKFLEIAGRKWHDEPTTFVAISVAARRLGLEILPTKIEDALLAICRKDSAGTEDGADIKVAVFSELMSSLDRLGLTDRRAKLQAEFEEAEQNWLQQQRKLQKTPSPVEIPVERSDNESSNKVEINSEPKLGENNCHRQVSNAPDQVTQLMGDRDHFFIDAKYSRHVHDRDLDAHVNDSKLLYMLLAAVVAVLTLISTYFIPK